MKGSATRGRKATLARPMSDRGLVAMALASLMLAFGIYVMFRSGARLHDWVAAGDLLGVIAWLRSVGTAFEPPAIVRYSVPDALWQLSFTTLVWLVWRSYRWNAAKVLCCAAPIAIGLGCELGQLVGWIEGVFDPWDLALSVLAIAAAIVFVADSTGGEHIAKAPHER